MSSEFFKSLTIKAFPSKAESFLIDFVKKNHYSASFPRNAHITFGLYCVNNLVGAGVFGIPVGANCKQKYSRTGKPVLELRRLCLEDWCPKNTESFFIGYMLRYLKKNMDLDGILSYADSDQCHFGTIYAASNFQYLGIKQDNNSIYRIKGTNKRFHSRVMYQYGTKTSDKLFELKKQGKLVTERSSPKHCWYYSF